MGQSTDSTLKSTAHAWVVYNKTTGEVLHIHHEVSFANAEPPSEDPTARALRLAGLTAGANIAVLETDPAKVGSRAPIKVDTATNTITAINTVIAKK